MAFPRGLLAFGLAFVTACSPAERVPVSPAHPGGAQGDRAGEPSFQRLRRLLAAVPDAGAVPDVLSPQERQAGRDLVAQLSKEDRAELMRAEGPTAQGHPLIYVLAGGNDPSALLALSQGKGGTDLISLWQRSGAKDMNTLLPEGRAITKRAAARWLRLAAGRLTSRADVTVALCDDVERVARGYGKTEILRLALEMSLAIEPTGERWLRAADAAARDLDLAGAKDAMRHARSSRKLPASADSILATEKDIADAELVEKPAPSASKLADALPRARAYWRLNHRAEAEKALAPYRGLAESHAGVAATIALMALAKLADEACPLTDSGSDLSRICFLNLTDRPVMKAAVEALRKGWQSKQGRDPLAAETYVGLVHVLPFIASFMGAAAGDANATKARVTKTVTELEAALAEAKLVAPELAGLHFYAIGLRRVFTADDRSTLWATPGDRADFEAQAAETAKRHGRDRHGQAGVTFAASLLALDGNSASLFDALPAEIDPPLRLPRAMVRLWAAVVQQNAEAVAAAGAEALQCVPAQGTDPVRRASTVLLVAETNVAMGGGAQALTELGQWAEQASVPGWPAELRLRALIDRAGVLSRSAQSAAAVELLDSIPAGEAAQAPDMANIAKAYALVLKASSARGDARKTLAAQLAKVGDASSARAFGVWRDAWVRELEFGAALERCGKRADCIKAAAKTRRLPDAEVDKRLGRWLAALSRHGTLSQGTFNASINYSSVSGLAASVDFAFALPAVEFPIN